MTAGLGDGMDEEHDTDVVEVTKEEFEVAVRRKRRDRELVEDVKPPKVPTLNRPPSPARNVVALHWTREVVLVRLRLSYWSLIRAKK